MTTTALSPSTGWASPIPWRRASWYFPALLPVLPFLAEWVQDDGSTFGASYTAPGVLAMVGLLLAFVVPSWLARCGPLVRKEAEQLRPAWLASLFLVQVPSVLLRNEDQAPALAFFVATCALLAAIPLGLEFQQRTLTSLLSQPCARLDLWKLKQRMLAGALATHAIAFLPLILNAPRQPDLEPFVFFFGVAPLVTWCTGAWWILLTRRLLIGLVFSLAAPCATAVLVSLVVSEVTIRLGSEGATSRFSDTDITWFLLAVTTPFYAMSAWWNARRRWLQLEAPDGIAAEAGLFGFSIRGTGNAASAGGGIAQHRTWWRWQLGKELRLQTISLLTLGITLAFALTAQLISTDDPLAQHRDLLRGLGFMFAAATVVLAGATPFAEERRLGTLEPQVLQPVSILWLWSSKLVLSGLITVVVGLVTCGMLFDALPREESWVNLGGPTLMMGLALFVPAILMSSGSADPLRALIASILISAVAVMLFAMVITLSETRANRVEQTIQAELEASPEHFIQAASQLSPEQADQLNVYADDRASRLKTSFLLGLALCLGAPTLLALGFAWRNFRQPFVAGRRLIGQAGLMLLALLLLLVAGAAAFVADASARARANFTLMAYQTVDFAKRLPVTDRLVWEALRPGPLFWGIRANLKVPPEEAITDAVAGEEARIPVPRARGASRIFLPNTLGKDVVQQHFRIPLRPWDRRLLIERGQIPEDLRTLLKADAERRGETGDNLPPLKEPPAKLTEPPRRALAPGGPPPTFQMSPEMMKRYGLIAPVIAAPDLPPTAPLPGQPAAEASSTNAPTPKPE